MLFIRTISVFMIAAMLGACAKTNTELYDPLEPLNRKTHGFNKKLDQYILKEGGEIYGEVFSPKGSQILYSVADTMRQPNIIVNRILQFKFDQALSATGRLLINATLGFAGFFDVASRIGLEAQSTDFGFTLGYWGIGEGPFVEVPLLGPSNLRDALGSATSFVLDPLNFLAPQNVIVAKYGVSGVKLFGDRNKYDDLINELLYESQDSYASTKLYYLQNRRFKFTGVAVDEIILQDPLDDEDFSEFDDFY